MQKLNIKDIDVVSVEGIDRTDFPHFSDARISHARHKSTDVDLTDEELEWLSIDDPEGVYNAVYEAYVEQLADLSDKLRG